MDNRIIYVTLWAKGIHTMIRDAKKEDIKAITDIYNHYILHTTACFSEEAVAEEEMEKQMRWIHSLGCLYIVWEDEASGEVLGFCYAHPWKEKSAYRKTLETTVYLSPNATGRGIGTQLMETLIGRCRHQGYHVLIADITTGNDASIRMHEKLGFVRKSSFEEVGRKFNQWLGVEDFELIL